MVMQLKPFFVRLLPIVCLSLFTAFSLGASADAQSTLSTAIPYQGQLSDGGQPANGQYDFEFKLFDATTAGAQIGSTNSKEDVQVNSGNFAVELDFGGSAFTGAGRFLEIGVRAGNSTGAFTTLAPRRPLLAVPYALYSLSGPNTQGGSQWPLQWPAQQDIELVGDQAGNNVFDIAFRTNDQNGLWSIWGPAQRTILTVRENGRVGINMDNPESILHIHGESALGNQLRMTAHNRNTMIQLGISDDYGYLHMGGNTQIRGGGSGSIFDGQVTIQSPAGLVVGSNGKSTSVSLHVADGDYGYLDLGGNTKLRGNGRESVFSGLVAIQAPTADQGLVVGANGKSTSVLLHVAEGDYGFLNLGGDTKLRGNGRESVFSGQVSVPTLQIRGGADVAEPFTISGEETIEPGMVVAIDPDNPGQLRLAGVAYDRTVAGVVSGAGGINPGLILQQEGSVAAGEHPVSLSGRVYVYADATNGAIEPGDLLTTSDTPGHAMKVTDHDRAQGAILGKAMSRLADGAGLVLVLVTLQ